MGYVEAALGTNEKIIIRVRKHPITLIWPLTYNFVLLLVVFAIATRIGNSPYPDIQELFFPVLAVGVFPICWFLFRALVWGNEEYFVTNRRVIQSKGVISKRMADSSLEKVNDVVLSQSWVGRLMNFGDVEILTASEIGVNDLRFISSPVRFKTELLNQKELLGSNEGFRAPADGQPAFSELIYSLEKLRKEGLLTEQEFSEKKRQLLSKI